MRQEKVGTSSTCREGVHRALVQETHPVSTTRWSALQKAIIAGSAIYALVFVAMLVLRPGTRQFYEAFFNGYQILAPLFAGICGIAYARRGTHRSSSQRFGWLLVGLGALSFAVGQGTWTYYESVRGVDVPFPGWADVGYLGTYPLLLTGVILLVRNAHRAGRARLVLDCAIAAGSVGMVSWHYLVQPLWQGSDIGVLGKLISVAYPLCDIAGLFTAMVLLSTASAGDTRQRVAFACLAAGMLLIAFFDTTFTYYTLHEAYHTGMWSDWSLSFGWIAVGYAALLPLWARAPERNDLAPDGFARHFVPFSVARMVLPYGAAAAAFFLTAVPSYLTGGRVSNSLIAVGSGLMLLVILRQLFTLVENQHLTSQLRAFNENLERLVAKRTRQLNSLHELTKAVNSTLDMNQVLAAASEHTPKTIGSDGIVIWLFDHNISDPDCAPRVHSHSGLGEQPGLPDRLAGLLAWDQVGTVTVPSDGGAAAPALFLRAPLRWQQRLVGMIGVLRRQGEFSAAETALLESVGIEVGTAMENARLYSTAVEAADRDPVTGLYNHRAIHQRLQGQIRRAELSENPFSMIMMDMDNFKLFNDTYGHPVGDEILKRVAKVLDEVCGTRAILGRYGGDEYIAILPGADTASATEVARRLNEQMSRESFRRPGDERVIPISMSFGIATYPTDSTNRHELLTLADSNLYRAKNSESRIVGPTKEQRINREMRSEGSFGVLDAMVTAVDNKDRYTRQHSEDVTEYALWIAEELGLSEETMRVIRTAGLLHDVGKIGVPDLILRKPGRLTDEEFAAMRKHPEIGALIVGGLPGMETIVDGVRFHHERWDGKGYPDGLAGEDIPLLGRILAVADAFSAMTTDRPYRRGLEWPVALREIQAHIGTQFDPESAHAFLRAAQEHRTLLWAGDGAAGVGELPKAA